MERVNGGGNATASGNAAAGGWEKVAILDAGAQYGKLIDRRVRELCVDTDILPLDTAAYAITQNRYK